MPCLHLAAIQNSLACHVRQQRLEQTLLLQFQNCSGAASAAAACLITMPATASSKHTYVFWALLQGPALYWKLCAAAQQSLLACQHVLQQGCNST
jgi:hypothetical protein